MTNEADLRIPGLGVLAPDAATELAAVLPAATPGDETLPLRLCDDVVRRTDGAAECGRLWVVAVGVAGPSNVPLASNWSNMALDLNCCALLAALADGATAVVL